MSLNAKFRFSASYAYHCVGHSVRIWPVTSHRDEERYQVNHSEEITCFVITTDSLHVITGSRDMSLKVWQVAGGKLTQVRTQFDIKTPLFTIWGLCNFNPSIENSRLQASMLILFRTSCSVSSIQILLLYLLMHRRRSWWGTPIKSRTLQLR